MRALVYQGKRDLAIRDMPQPSPRGSEVLIETRSVGICGSDLGIYRGEFPKISPPLIIGHEGSGIVREVGKEVTSVRVGDRVAVSPIVHCGKCEYCLRGRFSLCEDLKTLGMIDIPGEYAEFFVAPEENCHPIPDAISWESAALIDTLAGPALALSRTRVPLGGVVVVFGPGPAGLLFAHLCKLSGAGTVLLVGTRKERLRLGDRFGADLCLDVHEEDIRAQILRITNQRGADIVVEAAGSPRAVQDAVAVLKRGGELVLYGVFDDQPVPVDLLRFVLNEYSSFGIADNTAGYQTAIQLLATNMVDVTPLVSHVLSLEDTLDAFRSGRIEKRADGYIKGVVRFE